MFNKQLRNILLSAVALFAVLTFANNTTYAASSPVGVANYQQLINRHPDMAQVNEICKAAVKQAKDDFDVKSATMNDDEKKAYFHKLNQELQQKQQELINAIRDKVNAAIKAVAEDKGLTVVVDKSVIAYGGQDITDDVMKKITGR